MLAISGLTVRYGTATVLDQLDLAVGRGELFVLLGGSGAGKTTLLRAIAGFVHPAAGHILLDGRDLTALPPHRRPVNTMFQSYALFPHMSVASNVGFGLRQLGLPRTEIAARVSEMLELVSLPDFASRRPAQLSGGQQQRVALARSLAPRPRLLLLDEPLSALDRNLRGETRQELVGLQRRLGISFIVVTHDQEEALGMATRIGVMRDGRLVQIGTPAEVYEQPNCRFVAEFLGAANVLPAVVRGHSAGGSVLELPGIGGVVHTAKPTSRQAGDTVLLAIRPERLRFGVTADNAVSGTIIDCSYAGDSLTHSVRLADGSILRIAQSLRDGLAAQPAAIGDVVTLSWPPEAGILLDA